MSLKRGILYTFLTQAPTLLLYFVASTLMTRLLGDVGRGEYALLTNDAALLAMLLSFNLAFGLGYFTAKDASNIKRLVGVAATLLLLELILVPVLLFGMSNVRSLSNLAMPEGRFHWAYWAFLYLAVISSMVNSAIAAVLQGLKRFKTLNGMSILNAGASALGFVGLYLASSWIEPSWTLQAVLIVTACIMVLVTATWCVLYAMIVKIPPIPVRTWSVMRPVLAFSLIGHTSNLVNLINYRFDVWVVDQYNGAAQLGLYAVAVGIGQLLFYIPEPISRVMQPFLYGQVKDEMLTRFKVVARLNFTAVLVIALSVAATAYWIIPLLFGDVFIASVPALWLLLPGIVFCSGFKLLAFLLVNADIQRFNLMATSFGAVVTIALDFYMIPRWGIEGAAVASTCSYFVTMLVVVFVIRFRLKIPVHDLFFLKLSDVKLLRNFSSWKNQ